MYSLLRIHADDNVAVALKDIKKGEECAIAGASHEGSFCTIKASEDIPNGHKIALFSIGEGVSIIKYGLSIGASSRRIESGEWVHTHNMATLLAYDKSSYTFMRPPPPKIPLTAPRISAYRRSDGNIAIRNEVWIIPTVGCVNKTATTLANWAQSALLPLYPSIDGIFAWTHPYGCSQMGSDHESTVTILSDLVRHPHAGAVLVLSLGCENNTLEQFKNRLGSYAEDSNRVAFLTAQQEEDEIEAGKVLLRSLFDKAGGAKREDSCADELIVGMKCGGSDGFSGITANPLIGLVSDMLTGMGAKVILSEVPEMFGAESMLLNRCKDELIFHQALNLINDFKNYYVMHNQVVYENPSPGNKAGGITTLEEKSCGCVQKGGSSPIAGVLRYGERLACGSGGGLFLLEGPGNDIVSTTALSASGAHLILFSTGRGTPVGSVVPVIKIASNTDLARKKSKWIDFDAGRFLTEGREAVRDSLFSLMMQVVSGGRAKNEEYDYREIAIFKNGVTL